MVARLGKSVLFITGVVTIIFFWSRFSDYSLAFSSLSTYSSLFSNAATALGTPPSKWLPLFPNLLNMFFHLHPEIFPIISGLVWVLVIMSCLLAVFTAETLLEELLPHTKSPILLAGCTLVVPVLNRLVALNESTWIAGFFLLFFCYFASLRLISRYSEPKKVNPYLDPIMMAVAIFILQPLTALLFNLFFFFVLAGTARFKKAGFQLRSNDSPIRTLFIVVLELILVSAAVYFSILSLSPESTLQSFSEANLILIFFFLTAPITLYLFHMWSAPADSGVRTLSIALAFMFFATPEGHNNPIYVFGLVIFFLVYLLLATAQRIRPKPGILEKVYALSLSAAKSVGVLCVLISSAFVIGHNQPLPIHTLIKAIKSAKPNAQKVLTTAGLEGVTDAILKCKCSVSDASIFENDTNRLREIARQKGANVVIISKVDSPPENLIFETKSPHELIWFKLMKGEHLDGIKLKSVEHFGSNDFDKTVVARLE